VSESADEHDDAAEEAAEPGEDDVVADAGAAAQTEELSGAVEDMLETIRQAKVAPLVLSTVSTFASVAYGKLDANDLTEAKAAIDVIDALLPLLPDDVDEDIRRDFGQALTNLKLAYADAVAAAE
jgi:hypothetical protein